MLIRLSPRLGEWLVSMGKRVAASVFSGVLMTKPRVLAVKLALKWDAPHVLEGNRISTDHCSTLRSLTRAASRCTRSIRVFREIVPSWQFRAHGAQSTRVAVRRPASVEFQLDNGTCHFVHPAGLQVHRSLSCPLCGSGVRQQLAGS